jgi:hypothetical protein
MPGGTNLPVLRGLGCGSQTPYPYDAYFPAPAVARLPGLGGLAIPAGPPRSTSRVAQSRQSVSERLANRPEPVGFWPPRPLSGPSSTPDPAPGKGGHCGSTGVKWVRTRHLSVVEPARGHRSSPDCDQVVKDSERDTDVATCARRGLGSLIENFMHEFCSHFSSPSSLLLASACEPKLQELP